MNPARSLGPAVSATDFTAIWVYLTAPCIGSVVAALAYRALRTEQPLQEAA
jgi:glycerol uptake facilitator-like aquaporin